MEALSRWACSQMRLARALARAWVLLAASGMAERRGTSADYGSEHSSNYRVPCCLMRSLPRPSKVDLMCVRIREKMARAAFPGAERASLRQWQRTHRRRLVAKAVLAGTWKA